MGRAAWYSDLRDSVHLKNPVARKSLLTSGGCIEQSHQSDGSLLGCSSFPDALLNQDISASYPELTGQCPVPSVHALMKSHIVNDWKIGRKRSTNGFQMTWWICPRRWSLVKGPSLFQRYISWILLGKDFKLSSVADCLSHDSFRVCRKIWNKY